MENETKLGLVSQLKDAWHSICTSKDSDGVSYEWLLVTKVEVEMFGTYFEGFHDMSPAG